MGSFGPDHHGGSFSPQFSPSIGQAHHVPAATLVLFCQSGLDTALLAESKPPDHQVEQEYQHANKHRPSEEFFSALFRHISSDHEASSQKNKPTLTESRPGSRPPGLARHHTRLVLGFELGEFWAAAPLSHFFFIVSLSSPSAASVEALCAPSFLFHLSSPTRISKCHSAQCVCSLITSDPLLPGLDADITRFRVG